MKLSSTAFAVIALAGASAVTPGLTAGSSAGQPALFTAAQAKTGANDYAANCSRCHGANLEGVSAPALKGSASGLAGDTVSEAYTFISTQMPAGNPGTLSSKQYSDILAFILKTGGHPAGSAMLTPASAKSSKTKV